MTGAEYDRLHDALRSPARLLVLALEARGFRLDLVRGRVEIRPADRLTTEDRAALRALKPAVELLVQRRGDWCAWPIPVPPFDPTKAFDEEPEVTE